MTYYNNLLAVAGTCLYLRGCRRHFQSCHPLLAATSRLRHLTPRVSVRAAFLTTDRQLLIWHFYARGK